MICNIMKIRGVILSFIFQILERSLGKDRLEIFRVLRNPNRLESLIASVKINGLSFYFDIRRMDESFLRYLYKRIWEYDCYMLQNIKSESPTIFDIGAHIGMFSKFVLYKKPKASLWCFEPDKENMRVLKMNLLGLSQNVYFIEKGIHFEKDKKVIYVSKRGSWRSTILANMEYIAKYFSKGELEEKYEIELQDLDSFVMENLDKIKGIDLLKIAVPGEMEHLILEKSIETILKFRPQVSIYVYPKNENRVREFFRKMRYKEMESVWQRYSIENMRVISSVLIFVPLD